MGTEIALEIPLFNWGTARVARAEASYQQAAHILAARVLNAQSEVREAYAHYQIAYQRAKQYQETLIPRQANLTQAQILRYNAMQIGVFELLAEAREQIRTTEAAQDALRDFWLAEAALDNALSQ